jgi:protein PhnA
MNGRPRPTLQPMKTAARASSRTPGTPLADGDSVLLVKDLKVKGSSTVIKKGTKIKGIRLVYDNGDHDVDCKTDQGPFILKSEFLKKA